MPRKTAVTASPEPAGRPGAGGAFLLAGQRLAGERGFVDEQVPGREEPAVGRHQIPGLEVDHVAQHHVAHRHLALDPVPDHGRGLAHLPAEARGARCERYAWVKFRATLSTSISAMITALTGWPNAAETTLATSRISTSGLAK